MKQTAILVRDEIGNSVIRGSLHIGDKTFHVLERPWLDNRCNESCIPAGEYEVVFLPQSNTGKFQNIFELRAVPGRTEILIHPGNTVEHSQGCLLIGLQRGTLDGQPAVLDSQLALAELVEIVGRQNFILKIIGEQRLV